MTENMERKPKIGFIGQGWIGKHYANNFEERGYDVVRYAKEEPYSRNKDEIATCDIVFIAVPTPTNKDGFDVSILKEVIKLVGKGKTAVIKSTILPGTTEKFQQENPDIYVLHSPEFLAETTAVYDAANPNRNIVGIPVENEEYQKKAKEVIDTLPYAPYQLICKSKEAELIKYGGNSWLYLRVVFINMVHDMMNKFGVKWELVRDAMAADPRIGRSHMDPIHKSGRGAGGHCLIKDFAAFSLMYEDLAPEDRFGVNMLNSIKDKNLDLLISSNKDLDLIEGVYGKELLALWKKDKGLEQNYKNEQNSEKKVRCLVTGGAGFIGSNLVDELIAKGAEVIVIDNLLSGKRENVHPEAKFYEVDIRDLEKIKPLFEGIDYVFHLAAYPRVQVSIKEPLKSHDININGTLNVLIASRDAGVKKVIYSASSSAYGNQEKMPLREDMPVNPMSPYAIHKYNGEQYCRVFSEVYGLPTVSLRYFNIYGNRLDPDSPYSLVIGIFIKQRLEGKPMTIVGDGEQRRDFTNVADAVKANILAATNPNVGKGEVINIGRGHNYSVNELARMIGGPTANIPPRIEPKETLANIALAKELLNWEPTVNLPDWLEGYKKEMGLSD